MREPVTYIDVLKTAWMVGGAVTGLIVGAASRSFRVAVLASLCFGLAGAVYGINEIFSVPGWLLGPIAWGAALGVSFAYAMNISLSVKRAGLVFVAVTILHAWAYDIHMKALWSGFWLWEMLGNFWIDLVSGRTDLELLTVSIVVPIILALVSYGITALLIRKSKAFRASD